MADEPTQGVFVIEGEEVLFPDLSVVSMDEAMAFYDYTGYPIEDLIMFDDMDEDEKDEIRKKMRGPHVLSALMHIGYQRAHPKANEAKVRRLVKSASFGDAISKMADVEEPEGDDVPPSEESTSTPNESSTSSLLDSEPTTNTLSESSGTSSENGSSEQASDPASTGHGSLDTSSPVSDPETSVPSIRAIS